MQNIYQTFEFHKIQDNLETYSKTELGKVMISELSMLDSYESVKEALSYLDEMMSLNTRFGPLPIALSANAIKLIEMAKKTALLTPRDLNLIADDVLTAGNIQKYFKKIDTQYEKTLSLISGFFDLSNLEKEIRRVITNALTVADNATPELKEIRKKLKTLESTLESKITSIAFSYSKYLNDDNVTIRDGHFVLPVKTVDKSFVPGIIYDVSDSGATTFIEPLAIVQMNNDITALKVQENEEVRRILKQLTSLVLLQEGEILTNNRIIATLDFIQAKAQYAFETDSIIAESSDEQCLELLEARHPLIDKSKVVANSFHIDEQKRIIIISGPNAGGKTVSLKTVGILVMMNECGLAIPVKKGKLSYFKHIFIDIGDNQSLSDNLSTFSAHISQISEIINAVKGKDLVLLDELGTGTDPKEGEAIALSVTKYIESKHAFAMISSHFNALKEYAFTSEHLENSSMIFDEEKLLPTYKFRQGTAGHSYALYVARRYGIPKDICEQAEEYIKAQDNSGVSTLIDNLQHRMDEANKLMDQLKLEKHALEEQVSKFEKDREAFQTRKDKFYAEANDEKQKLIYEAQRQVESILNKLKKGDITINEVASLKQNLIDMEENEEVPEFNEKLEVNNYVSVPSLGINGRIERINGKKAHIKSDTGLAFDIELTKLHVIEQPKSVRKVAKPTYETTLDFGVGLELNIIGQHVDEAKESLIDYLSKARTKRFPSVRIIHGFGSGALRKMVRAYLDTQKDLSYRPGDCTEGAGGATVVMFKR